MTAIRWFLIGKGYNIALRALKQSSELHTAMRKDGKTPYFVHVLVVTSQVITLHDILMFPEETIAEALLHDLVEDTHIKRDQIYSDYGERIGKGVQRLTKQKDGISRSSDEVFAELALDPCASIVKGADRAHNHQTMVGVFSESKQKEYIQETVEYILPMLKEAREQFPQQVMAYLNLKTMLLSQIELIEKIHQAKRR